MDYGILSTHWELISFGVVVLFVCLWWYWRSRWLRHKISDEHVNSMTRWGLIRLYLDELYLFGLSLVSLLLLCVVLVYIPSMQLAIKSAKENGPGNGSMPGLAAELRGVQEGLLGLGATLEGMQTTPPRLTLEVDPGIEAELRKIADKIEAFGGTKEGGSALWLWILLLIPILAFLYFGLAQRDDLSETLRRASARIAFGAAILAALAGTFGAMAAAVGEGYESAKKIVEYKQAKAGEDSEIPLISFRQIPFPDGTVKLDQRTFVVPFAEDGDCISGRPVVEEPEFRTFLVRLGRVLALCSGRAQQATSSGDRVTDKALIRLRGFASTSQVPKEKEDQCGGSGRAANVEFATARVAKVQAALAEGCSEEYCEFRSHMWNDEHFHMVSELFVDQDEGGFSVSKGELNRRVEVTILDSGDCELPAALTP